VTSPASLKDTQLSRGRFELRVKFGMCVPHLVSFGFASSVDTLLLSVLGNVNLGASNAPRRSVNFMAVLV
jgi:hypothetical protein